MLNVLRRQNGVRRGLVVAAAYLFAVQMLLAGVVATQMAIAGPALPEVVCSGSQANGAASDDSGKADGHRGLMPCAVCALASFVPPIPRAPAAIADHTFTVTDTCWPSTAAAPEDGRREPRLSQGPPGAA